MDPLSRTTSPGRSLAEPQMVSILISVRPLPAWIAPATTVVGFALFAPVSILFLASGLVVPQPWLTMLWAAGAAFLVYAIVNRQRPWIVLATPVAAILVWIALVTLGGAVLNWTA